MATQPHSFPKLSTLEIGTGHGHTTIPPMENLRHSQPLFSPHLPDWQSLIPHQKLFDRVSMATGVFASINIQPRRLVMGFSNFAPGWWVLKDLPYPSIVGQHQFLAEAAFTRSGALQIPHREIGNILKTSCTYPLTLLLPVCLRVFPSSSSGRMMMTILITIKSWSRTSPLRLHRHPAKWDGFANLY